ncbi:MAG: type II toxin-antitoxin system VapC family toxin [Gemmatimonadota bacterium]|nr:type II toxin-antitoxin system VapC family toxin [Gemmatimonadota bacterium]
MIVVDASVVLDMLIRAPGVETLEERLFSERTWNAPHLVDLEVAQVLRRWTLGGRIGAGRARRALELLDDLPLHRWSHRTLLPRIWSLRENATAYDAAYLALAEGLECDLVTRDERLARVPGHRASVETI